MRLFLALRRKVAERGYEAISLIDVDGVKKLMGFAPAGVFMLLHEEAGVSHDPRERHARRGHAVDHAIPDRPGRRVHGVL